MQIKYRVIKGYVYNYNRLPESSFEVLDKVNGTDEVHDLAKGIVSSEDSDFWDDLDSYLAGHDGNLFSRYKSDDPSDGWVFIVESYELLTL